MKISKDSWHYRFNDFSNDNFSYRFSKGTYTTCSYIRTTIASFFATLIKCVFVLCIAGMALWIVGSMIGVPIMIYMGITSISELIGVPCIIGWIAVIVVLAALFASQAKEWVHNLSAKLEDRPKKEPNVFVQAIIDKHNKFCTRVIAED